MNKKPLIYIFYALSAISTLNATQLIAFWDFNDGYDFENDSVQIIHSASQGSGTLYQQRADTDGNGKGGNSYFNNELTGISSSINVTSGKAIAWDDVRKSGDNDAEFFLTFSTSGFRNIQLSFDLKGNDNDSIVSYDIKYSLSRLIDVTNLPDVIGTIKDFKTDTSISLFDNKLTPESINVPAFDRVTIDFFTVTEMNDKSFIAMRLDDFKENNAMSIDNLLITGNAIPEPSIYILVLGTLALGLVCWKQSRSIES